MLELERREDDLGAEAGFLARLAPPEAPGDHQVDHEDQRVGIGERPEGERDSLTDARDLVHGRARQAVHGGSTVRSTNGLSRRTRSSRRPATCAVSASMYTVTSGSSGTGPA